MKNGVFCPMSCRIYLFSALNRHWKATWTDFFVIILFLRYFNVQVFTHGRDITVFPVKLLFTPHWTGLFSWTRLSRYFLSIPMASSTSAYSFTDEEVSQLANCNNQGECLRGICAHEIQTLDALLTVRSILMHENFIIITNQGSIEVTYLCMNAHSVSVMRGYR